MSHSYEKPAPQWDKYRSVAGPIRPEQKARILELRDQVDPEFAALVDALFLKQTYAGAIVREGTINENSATILIQTMEDIIEGQRKAVEEDGQHSAGAES
jgi:hypothetical protein